MIPANHTSTSLGPRGSPTCRRAFWLMFEPASRMDQRIAGKSYGFFEGFTVSRQMRAFPRKVRLEPGEKTKGT